MKLNLKTGLVMTVIAAIGVSFAYSPSNNNNNNQTSITTDKKMKIEIWSDVMCPFCYIGKRKFEKALSQFEHKENVIVEWKSYQLDPSLQTDPSKNTIEHLAQKKGWTMEYTNSTINYVVEMAKGVGLDYHFEKAVVANSFDAHRIIQYAKSQGKGDAAEERLFKAYFTEGKNTADHTTLIQLGTEIGLDAAELKKILESNAYTTEVKKDLAEGDQVGVTGVPFFVFDRKIAVSGAQDPSAFLEALKKSWKTFEKETATGK